MTEWTSIPEIKAPSVAITNRKVRIDLRGKQAKRKSKRPHEGDSAPKRKSKQPA